MLHKRLSPKKVFVCLAALGAGLILMAGLSLRYEIRPPWMSKARWHLGRYYYWRSEPGTPVERSRHKEALLALGVDAVPPIIEKLMEASDKFYRERAVSLLKEIGPAAKPLLLEALENVPGKAPSDHDERIWYALFIAFRDWDAFDHWLAYAASSHVSLHDSFMDREIEEFWTTDMPEYYLMNGNEYRINPKFAEWWSAHGKEIVNQP